jgi:predicted cupin superfamily sugar epimerase
MTSKDIVQSLIAKLSLIPHPEGGYYKEIFRSSDNITCDKGQRNAITTILYLLPKGVKSKLHKVTSDEIWNFIEGAPATLHRVTQDFEHDKLVLGSLDSNSFPVHVIKSNQWQAAESTGEYTLVSCAVGPGFDFKDFTMLRDEQEVAQQFLVKIPSLSDFI